MVVKGAYFLASQENIFPASMVEAKHFTHIYYSSIIPDTNTYTINLSDVQRQKLKDFVIGIKNSMDASVPAPSVILSIAGDKRVLTAMASTAANRSVFIKSCTTISRECGFDGMDFDWQFPERPDQMRNFESLLQEWRVEIENEYRPLPKNSVRQLTLSAAVYYTVQLTGRKYPVDSIARNLDWVHVMTYGYGKDDASVTEAHAKLFNPDNQALSTSHGLNDWIRAGVPKEKVIMGLPLFGRTWKLADEFGDTGIGAPAVGFGPGANGFMTYSDIKSFNNREEAKVIYDGKTGSTYSISNDSWIGFDSRDSIEKKITYAREQLGLGGYFFWSVDGDYNWELSSTAFKAW